MIRIVYEGGGRYNRFEDYFDVDGISNVVSEIKSRRDYGDNTTLVAVEVKGVRLPTDDVVHQYIAEMWQQYIDQWEVGQRLLETIKTTQKAIDDHNTWFLTIEDQKARRALQLRQLKSTLNDETTRYREKFKQYE